MQVLKRLTCISYGGTKPTTIYEHGAELAIGKYLCANCEMLFEVKYQFLRNTIAIESDRSHVRAVPIEKFYSLCSDHELSMLMLSSESTKVDKIQAAKELKKRKLTMDEKSLIANE